MGLRVFPLDGVHNISISNLGPDSDAATRLETADGSGPRSGLCNTCIRELHSGRMALQCALPCPVIIDAPTGCLAHGLEFFFLLTVYILYQSRTSDLTRKGLLVWRPLTSQV